MFGTGKSAVEEKSYSFRQVKGVTKKHKVLREKRDRSVPNLRPEIEKNYGMMEDGKKSYADALEDLR